MATMGPENFKSATTQLTLGESNYYLSSNTSGSILKFVNETKNSFNYKCMVKKGQTVTVFQNRTMGIAGGDVILTMKEGTVFQLSGIQQSLKVVGNSTTFNTDELQWSGEVKIYPDTESEYIDRNTTGFINLNTTANPSSSYNDTRMNFVILVSKSLAIYTNYPAISVKPVEGIESGTGVTAVQPSLLITADNKLNVSQIENPRETKEYTKSKVAIDIKTGELPTPLVESYYAKWPSSWKSLTNIQENEDFNASLDAMDISKLRGIFGMPYQYLPTTDCRIDGSESEEVFGITYTEMIASRLPLLYLTPGEPVFLADAGDDRNNFIADALQFLASSDTSHLDNLVDGYSGKLYSIEATYGKYFKYVNPMARMGAFFLGLDPKIGDSDDEARYKKLEGVDLVNYNWAWNGNGDYNGNYSGSEDGSSNTKGFHDVTSGFKDLQKYVYYKAAIPFYINSEVTFQETMTNETTESSLASGINGLSDKARELQFLIGSTTSVVAQNFDNVAENLNHVRLKAENFIEKLTDSGNIFSNLLKNVKTVVSGGRLMFPNIWSNSSFSKSYSIDIRLTTPDFDRKSWWMNIYVPLCHLIAFVLPRGEFQNGYTSPFIVKAFYKGMFNIDMGIITDMSITKGKEGGWTKDGLPTVVDVQLTIQDLYSTLSMSPTGGLMKSGVLQNIAEMDYLANTCGVNINEPDITRMVAMYVTFNIENVLTDIPTNITTALGNKLSNKISKIYQSFI